MFSEPTPMRSNVAEDSTGLAELAYTVMPTFGSLLLSECGVIALFGFILSAQRQFYCMFLIFASIASEHRWLRSITLQIYVPFL